ncbi:TnpV protein [Kocuria marina]|uniref:TnpV protein n=1 Tax=Kocuria marina TaxID=223184 RepID=UPI0022E0B6AD|nr:TnpV protein [Kocuria marina]
MNTYGKTAQQNWMTLAPSAYQQIENPEQHFTMLGQDAMAQVQQLQTQIAGPDPMDEGYLQKVGRLQAAKNQAEEVVRENLLTPPRESWETTEEPEEETDETFQAIQAMHRAALELEDETDRA